MNVSRLLPDALRSLSRHRLRTGFIVFTTFVGIAALTFVLAVGAAAQRKMLKTVRQVFGDAGILVGAGPHRMMGGPRSDSARLTIDDIEAVVKALPQIETWDPQQSLSSTVRRGAAVATARIVGVSERYPEVWSRRASRGVYFDAAAVRRSDRVALIGPTVAHALFGQADPLQGEILIGTVPFTVVGVLETFGTDLHGMDRDNEVLVPLSTLQRRVANVDTIGAAKLLLRDGTDAEQTAGAARRLLRQRHALSDGQPDDFNILTPVEVQRMVGTARRILALYLPLAAVIILAVGGIVTTVLMLGSVTARQREIGVRRAVGARPIDISLLFLAETVFTIALGGLAGVLAGFGAAEVIALHLHLVGVFSWIAVSIGLLTAAAVGLLAGVVPARRAAALLPTDALR